MVVVRAKTNHPRDILDSDLDILGDTTMLDAPFEWLSSYIAAPPDHLKVCMSRSPNSFQAASRAD
jgi:hypothetical protein